MDFNKLATLLASTIMFALTSYDVLVTAHMPRIYSLPLTLIFGMLIAVMLSGLLSRRAYLLFKVTTATVILAAFMLLVPTRFNKGLLAAIILIGTLYIIAAMREEIG